MGTDCILPPVPARTSTVVTLGLILLAVVGVGAIFGNTILAVVAPGAPPAAPPTTGPAPAPAPPPTGASGLPPPGSEPTAPRAAKDGSS